MDETQGLPWNINTGRIQIKLVAMASKTKSQYPVGKYSISASWFR